MTKEKIIIWCDRLIDWLTVAVIFLTPIYFAYFAENYNVFELNKQLIVRGGVSLILGLWLIKICLGAKVFYRDKKLWWLTGGVLAVYVLLGEVFSIRPQLSWLGNYERQQGVYSLVYYWLWFVLLLITLRSPQQLKRLMRAVLAASALVSLYGIAQHFKLDPKQWIQESRSFSALGQPNFLGHYLVIIIPLTISGFWWFKGKSRYYWLNLLLILQSACLLFTLSRSAWLGLMAGAVAIGLLFLIINQKRRILATVVICLLLVLLGLNSLSRSNFNGGWSSSPYYQRFVSAFGASSPTNKIRLLYWSVVPEAFSQAPWWRSLIGFGQDAQINIFAGLYRGEWAFYEVINALPDRAHNIILDLWLEYGVIGFLVLSGFIGYLLFKAMQYLRQRRAARDGKYYIILCLVAAELANFFTLLFGFPLTTHYVYYYFIAAVLAWLLFNSSGHELKLDKLSSLFKWLMAAVIMCFVAFTLYVFTARAFIADYWLMKAKRAESQANCADTLDYANKMLDAWPLAPRLKEQYIFFSTNCLPLLTNQSDLTVAAKNMLAVLDDYPAGERPGNYNFLLLQAHAYSALGRHVDSAYYAAAAAAYQELLKLNPAITVIYQDYARMKMWAGDLVAVKNIVFQGLVAMPPTGLEFADLPHYGGIIRQRAYFFEILAMASVRQNDLVKARSYYLLANKTEPNNKLNYQRLADLAWRLGKKPEAMEWLARGRQLDPSDNAWDYNEALYYWQSGNQPAALAAIKRAVELNGTDEQATKLLKDILAGAKP